MLPFILDGSLACPNGISNNVNSADVWVVPEHPIKIKQKDIHKTINLDAWYGVFILNNL